ncbi:kinase-like domain-containing protein [Rhizophagus clarus]|uniref:Kinase-like domain-containing protein n=2 Tax=Rhizophagus clarus TaxID=94130 RepID=A0A8H3L6Q9_9GLOM|nr:kinase-like domain-containing protein [Rhizophagus clarus]
MNSGFLEENVKPRISAISPHSQLLLSTLSLPCIFSTNEQVDRRNRYKSYQTYQEIIPWDEREVDDELYPQSQKLSLGWCMECRKLFSGKKWCRPCNAARFYEQSSEWTSWRPGLDNLIIQTQITANNVHSFFEWIPFSNFDHVTYLAKGGYSVVYKAIWKQGPIIYWDTNIKNWERFGSHEVVLKVIRGSQKNLNEFINELSAHHKFNTIVGHVLRCFGISRWEDTGDFIVVTSYAKDGNLRQYIRKNFVNFSWIERLITLKDIAEGLEIIHNSGYVHRDLHTGNILRHGSWTMISDLGLTWRQDSTTTGKLYGVLPYIAPEILSGDQYSSASDIYSFAMIMYEVASGKIPYYNEDINPIKIIQGSRPELPPATPFIYTELMKSCWDSDPKERPNAGYLVNLFDDWIHCKRKQLIVTYNSFQNAEIERKNSNIDIEENTIDLISQLISIKWPIEASIKYTCCNKLDEIEKLQHFTLKVVIFIVTINIMVVIFRSVERL